MADLTSYWNRGWQELLLSPNTRLLSSHCGPQGFLRARWHTLLHSPFEAGIQGTLLLVRHAVSLGGEANVFYLCSLLLAIVSGVVGHGVS